MTNNHINKTCNKIEVEMNFRYGDDDSNCILDLNNKKKLEEKKSILSNFDIKSCKKYSIPIDNIIFLYDNPFINELQSQIKDDNDNKNLYKIIIESLLNKYCVVLRNNLINENKKFYFLEDIPNNSREIICFTKIISFNKEINQINLFSNFDLNDEIQKNKQIMILIEPRIEKVLKKNKKAFFNEILSNAEFSYDITNENETKVLSNGLNYLGLYENEFL